MITNTVCKAIKQGKTESREEKGSVKNWELHNDNSNVERDSSDQSDTDKSLDSLKPTGILHLCTVAPPHFLLFVSSPRHSSICILFHLAHFAKLASRKTEL